ncbi:MAG: carboxypeptidase-like regulatory domain-containing protein, partial [Chryseobacterium sp.]|nr:carboxypeptidase-like regulatory domain-containing protein [Chryseobacterium sp.]
MKTQRKNLILLSFFMGICIWSQTSISGKVTFKNKPLKDINVTLKDSYDGATSDENGNYSFITSESGDKILVFSGLNYDEV